MQSEHVGKMLASVVLAAVAIYAMRAGHLKIAAFAVFVVGTIW